MNNLDESLVRDQMSVYVDIVIIVYNMLLDRLTSYSEIDIAQRHQIAGQLANALTIKACLNANSEDVTYCLERIEEEIKRLVN